MNWGIFLTALGSAGVEFFETAAIAYAILRSGYPSEAILGTLTGLMLVGIAAAVLGTGLQLIPLRLLQVIIGLTLLWFGWGWYKKSILRQARHRRAGWLTHPLEAEGIELEANVAQFSRLNFFLMTKSAAIEALEVALVVVTLGLASKAWHEAIAGAAVALIATTAIVLVLHGYLLKIPDVWLKLSAGILLLAYGTFWLAQGIGIESPIGELALPVLIGAYGLISLLAIQWLRTK